MKWRFLFLGAVALLAVFTAVASQLLLRYNRIVDDFDFPFYQWWVYLYLHLFVYRQTGLSIWLQLLGAGVGGAILPVFCARAWYVRHFDLLSGPLTGRLSAPQQVPPIEATSQTHGTARWATQGEQFDAWPGPRGIVVGEADDPRSYRGAFKPRDRRTWGRGGTAPFLIDNCKDSSPHSLVIAGTRTGKTMSLIPTLAVTWADPCVVFDPAGEIEPMVRRLREAMGHRVWTLDLDHTSTIGFNVIEWIDINSPTAEIDALSIVEWVTGYTAKSDRTAEFFKDSGKSTFAALLLDTMWNPTIPPDLRNLRTVRALQSQSMEKLKKLLKRISRDSVSIKARQLASQLVEGADDTLSGIFLNAHHCTEWLTTSAFADLVSGDAFRASDIVKGDTDIFLCLPSKALEGTSAGVARCIIGALLNACYDANGARHAPVLFCLDDAKQLKRMEILEHAGSNAAKYGAAIHMLLQGRSQLDEVWGDDGARTWLDNAGWVSYSGVGDIKTAEEISKSIGTRGLEVRTRSRNMNLGGRGRAGRGRTTTTSEIAGPLIHPAEVMQLRSDARLVLVRGRPPVICGAPLWYRRREPVYRRLGENRFFARRGP